MNTAPYTTKISISVCPGLLDAFNGILGQVIKRDAFFNLLIARELPYLRAELSGLRNSEAARRHIGRELRKLKPQTINVVVEKAVAADLKQVVEEGNLVRDAVLNYLLFCLDPDRDFFRNFDLPRYYTHSDFETDAEPPSLSALYTISETLADPFYYLRTAVREKWSCGLYALEMPAHWHGLACHLPDESVPGTKPFKEAQQEVDFSYLLDGFKTSATQDDAKAEAI